MAMNLDWDYHANVAIEIKDGPVLGYHILMAVWDMAAKDSQIMSCMHHMEPDQGYSLAVALMQRLNKGFLIDAFGSAIDPREYYKDFRVSSRYILLGEKLTEEVRTRLRQSAKQFGKSILMYLDEWRQMDLPPLEGFVCQFSHQNLHEAVMVHPKDEYGNEIMDKLICLAHGEVEELFRDWQLLPLFPDNS